MKTQTDFEKEEIYEPVYFTETETVFAPHRVPMRETSGDTLRVLCTETFPYLVYAKEDLIADALGTKVTLLKSHYSLIRYIVLMADT